MVKKVLNLYSGIGGNRKLWEDVEVTAVEINPQIAEIYKDLFPDDNIIITDAHEYLLNNYQGWDFIWSSPPCQTHSCIRAFAGVGSGQVKPTYPDMALYEEILFLRVYCKTRFCVENVVSWYPALVKPQTIGKNQIWSNFPIISFELPVMSEDVRNRTKLLEKHYGVELSFYQIDNKLKILRNCVHPKLGLHIFKCALKYKQEQLEISPRNEGRGQ